MSNNNQIRIVTFVSFIFLLTNDMTSKYIIGFITGVFISTKYNFKPYINLIEDKIINLQKELEIKRIHSQKSIESNWNWPWSR
jgi:hypothetical protein